MPRFHLFTDAVSKDCAADRVCHVDELGPQGHRHEGQTESQHQPNFKPGARDAKARLREPAHGSSQAVAAAGVTSLGVSFPIQRRCRRSFRSTSYGCAAGTELLVGCALTRIAAAFAVRFIWLASIGSGQTQLHPLRNRAFTAPLPHPPLPRLAPEIGVSL
jgi:hypothetical protein